jgi:hypothetical protein
MMPLQTLVTGNLDFSSSRRAAAPGLKVMLMRVPKPNGVFRKKIDAFGE